MKAEQFIKDHFKGIEKETWYSAIVAIAEGYAKHCINETINKIDSNWKFDNEQQPISNWHDKQYLLEELEKLIQSTDKLKVRQLTIEDVSSMNEYMDEVRIDYIRKSRLSEQSAEDIYITI